MFQQREIIFIVLIIFISRVYSLPTGDFPQRRWTGLNLKDDTEKNIESFTRLLLTDYLDSVSRSDDEVIFIHMFIPPAPPALSSKASYKPGSKQDNETTKHPFGHDFFLSDPKGEHWQRWHAEVEEMVDKLKTMLANYERRCDDRKLRRRAILHSGPAGQGICELAKKNNATLVITGSRGLNKIRRTFLGSVSGYVTRHCHCPVMVVPPFQ